MTTKDLTVFFLTEHFPPKRGGPATYSDSLTRELAKRGVKVHIMTYNWGDDHVSEGLNRSITYLTPPKSLRKERFFPIFAFKKAFSVLKNKKIDIIHVGYGFFAIYLGVFMGYIFRKPVIFTIQNVPPREMLVERFSGHHRLHKGFKRFYLWLTEMFGKGALRLPYSALICVSKRTSLLAQKAGAPERKISVVPNGVNVKKFRPRPKQKNVQGITLEGSTVLLNVAGFIEHKGQRCLVEAMPDLMKRYPNIKLLLVGPAREKKYKQSIIDLIKSLKLVEYVYILESVPHDKMPNIFNACDIYVQPSLEEGFCISILEAMACGKPVIGTKTGEIPKFINESKGGILIEPASFEQIREAVLDLLSTNKKIRDLGEKSRKYVEENFSWKSVAEKTLEVYEKAISSRLT
jgi:glycosyltransferase involved in cell wall biosynthesis